MSDPHSQSFAQTFFDDLPLGAYRTRPDGTIERANAALARLLGYDSVEQLLADRSMTFYKNLQDRVDWIKAMDAYVEGGEAICFKVYWRNRATGEFRYVKNSARAIRQDGKVIAYEGVVMDLTEQPHALPAPLHSTGFEFRGDLWTDEVKDKLPICILRKNRQREIIWANKAFLNLENISLHTLVTERNTDSKLYPDEHDDFYRATDEKVFNEGQSWWSCEPHRSQGKETKTVEVVKVPLFEKDTGKVIGAEVYFWNTKDTLPLRTLESLNLQIKHDASSRRLIDRFYPGRIEMNPDGAVIYVNEAAASLLRRDGARMYNKPISEFVAPTAAELADSKVRKARSDRNPDMFMDGFEIDLVAGTDHLLPVEVTSYAETEGGKLARLVWHIRDLSTQREHAKSRFNEIHHRVKNNLHTINVLLSQESNRSASEETKEVLIACQARVMVMAALHEQLYQSAESQLIDVGAYMMRLVDHLITTYRRPWQTFIRHSVVVDQNVRLSQDVLTPCALVLNELISNACKHAFPKPQFSSKPCEIVVRVGIPHHTGFQLQVEDNGIGTDLSAEKLPHGSLGGRLVHTLIVNQLQGTLKIDKPESGGPGTRVTANFADMLS